ncbi:hypothetical protein WR164_02760 [Philodulcilactobacillus myokoensis]|uniref:SCP domain-containing protein n=1 Tax=Philodulcilactobacillus myokoensis TaxID=2929573 RepID=A0A9W6ES99_9LACO|nr:hypothetical protein [Philodulcilactobacillus myokoensis]GLB46297.1 hypothetical protein WR164_02760 [Philodulcilactobacillus myokoensis]
MKFKKILFASVVLLIADFSFSFLSSNQASAKSKSNQFVSYTYFPKKMRGNWYNYISKHNQSYYHITKNKITSKLTFGRHHYTDSSYLVNLNHGRYKKFYKHHHANDKKVWIMAASMNYRHIKWIQIQNIFADTATEDYFNIAKRGKYMVLSEAVSAGIGFTQHFYHNKKVAKHLAHKRYAHFLY